MAFMQDLPTGTVVDHRVGGNHGTIRYQITRSAAEHPNGWVEVYNLTMTDDEAERLLNTPGAVEAGCDPRDGFFAFSHPVEVEVVSR